MKDFHLLVMIAVSCVAGAFITGYGLAHDDYEKRLLAAEVAPQSPASSTSFRDVTLYDGWFEVRHEGELQVIGVQPTGSMFPTLSESTVIILERTSKVSIGDIAVYALNGKDVIHRIVGESGDDWIFRGDNSDGTEIVPKSSVVWRVYGVLY